ncbi:MAG: (2Fe-2S)-binding protein [Leptospiraceae bacterium]|nr:(2Fe-2S)-binding protein [Leptospiraceae bacterium]
MADRRSPPVCSCCRVTARDIGEAVSRPSRMPSFESLLASTGAGSQCGACLGDVYSIYLSRRHLRRIQQEDQMPLPFLAGDGETL